MINLKRFLRNILLFPLVMMGVLNQMTGNLVADTGELIPIYYDKVALKAEKPFCILEQFAVKSKNIPVFWTRNILVETYSY